MATTRWGGDPLPESPEAAVVPAHLKALSNSMDARTVHVAIDPADRNVRYIDLPPGSIVTTEDGYAWLKTGAANSWWTMTTPRLTATVTPATGWSSEGCLAEKIAYHVDVTMIIRYNTGDDIAVGGGGNTPDTLLASIADSKFWPKYKVHSPARTSITGGTCELRDDGKVYLTDLHTGSSLTTGHGISANFSFQKVVD